MDIYDIAEKHYQSLSKSQQVIYVPLKKSQGGSPMEEKTKELLEQESKGIGDRWKEEGKPPFPNIPSPALHPKSLSQNDAYRLLNTLNNKIHNELLRVSGSKLFTPAIDISIKVNALSLCTILEELQESITYIEFLEKELQKVSTPCLPTHN